MILENNTSIPIECVAIKGGKTVIPPKNKVHIAVGSGNDLLKINHLYGSGRKALFDFDNVYHVVINSEIAVRGAGDDAVIVVSGELVHFDLEFVYDKFFFHTQNCTIFLENISVSNLCALQQKLMNLRKRIPMEIESGLFYCPVVFGLRQAFLCSLSLLFGQKGGRSRGG